MQHAFCQAEAFISNMSGSLSLLPQMAGNTLTTEGATALVLSIRKNSKSMMEEINISVRAYVLESLQDYTFLGTGWITELPPSKTVWRLAVCFI